MVKIVVRIKEGSSGFDGIDYETFERDDSTKGEHAIALQITDAIRQTALRIVSASPRQIFIDGNSDAARKLQKKQFDNL